MENSKFVGKYLLEIIFEKCCSKEKKEIIFRYQPSVKKDRLF